MASRQLRTVAGVAAADVSNDRFAYAMAPALAATPTPAQAASTSRSVSAAARPQVRTGFAPRNLSLEVRDNPRGGVGGGTARTGGSGGRTAVAGGAMAEGGYPGGGYPANAPPTTAGRQGAVEAAGQTSLGTLAETEPVDGGEGEITVKAWSPDTPYLKAMRAAPARAYTVYLEQRPRFADSPSFYLDCAEYLLQKGQTALGVRVLTDVAELGLDDPALDRIVAHRLAQLGYRDLAIGLFDKVRGLRPEEPQSWRDLALALADRGDTRSVIDARGAVTDYNRALSLLNKVIMNHWDRFEGIEAIALMEANRIVARGRALPAGSALAVPLDPRLVRNLPCDVRIVMTWDTDMTDMDLWVTEPDGEKCFYGHNRTVIGGRISNDFTQGYGPEEYVIHHAMPGTYRIQSNYYGSRQQRLTGGTTVQATVITDFGRPTEKRRHLTLRLTRENGTVDIGSIVWKAR
jgi:Ca-activated chloride channel family protein